MSTKSRNGQGNRVLSEEDFEQVVLVPTGVEAFALDTHFQGLLVFQQVMSEEWFSWSKTIIPEAGSAFSSPQLPAALIPSMDWGLWIGD